MSRLAKIAAAVSLLLGSVGALTAAASAQDSQGHDHDHHGPETYVVRTLAGGGPGSLADAIEDANSEDYWSEDGYHGEHDRIVFAVAGVIEPTPALPTITAPVDLDATTAPGYAPGAPTVDLQGDGSSVGIDVGPWAKGTRIAGLAIGGFETGIVVGADHTSVCAAHIGTDLSGERAEPNGTGIELLADYGLVGPGDCCDEGNLVSGNSGDGIVVRGSHDHVAGNLIGTEATGAEPLPNGGAGIRVGPGAAATLIGGAGDEGPGNTIAFNLGPGVLVEPGGTETRISSNSIFGNGGRGIEVPAGGDAPSTPVLTGFSASPGATTVQGTFTGEPEADYTLEFFASATCVPIGQGRTLLGSAALSTDPAGQATFEAAALAPLPAGTKFITATATGGASPSTSEFSACLGEPEPPAPEAAMAPPPLVQNAPAAAAAPSELLPINGKTITIEPKTGNVKIKAPGETRFRPLTELESVPIGSTVDAVDGKARINSATAEEVVQSAAFLGGVFRVLQTGGRTLTTMRLVDTEFEPCTPTSTEAATASARGGRGGPNRLWGSGQGSFRTEGNYGSATVRGTIWYVADRCEATFFKVNRGVVAVRDFPHGRTVTLRAGGTYLAAP